MKLFRRRSTVIVSAALILTTTGTALAATDAVPGDPFKLGQENRILAETTLLTGHGQTSDGVLQVRREGGSGAGIGAALKVVNQAGGAARGIDIEVAPGRPPITVKNGAGKASGLDVDRLDGLDSRDFLQPRIYSDGSALLTGPGAGKIFGLNAINANLGCDTGDIAMSAGGNALDPDDDLNGITPFRSSFQIEFQDNGNPGKFSANIICLDAAQPFRD